jgi:hypothetical protein
VGGLFLLLPFQRSPGKCTVVEDLRLAVFQRGIWKPIKTAEGVTLLRKETFWPKNLTYKAIYHPDTDRMVQALKIVLEMPTGNEQESKELFPLEQKRSAS